MDRAPRSVLECRSNVASHSLRDSESHGVSTVTVVRKDTHEDPTEQVSPLHTETTFQ